jgi:hypothetical protein
MVLFRKRGTTWAVASFVDNELETAETQSAVYLPMWLLAALKALPEERFVVTITVPQPPPLLP